MLAPLCLPTHLTQPTPHIIPPNPYNISPLQRLLTPLHPRLFLHNPGGMTHIIHPIHLRLPLGRTTQQQIPKPIRQVP